MSENKDKVLAINVILAEFNALRGEIKDRSTFAHTLLNINITATTALSGFVLVNKANEMLLLILPLLSSALGMLFVDHSYNINNLGNYINDRLRPLVDSLVEDSRLLGYEAFVDEYEQKKVLRFLPLGVPLTLVFAGPPVAALVFSWTSLRTTWAWTLWIAGLLMFTAFIVMWFKFLYVPYMGRDKDGSPG